MTQSFVRFRRHAPRALALLAFVSVPPLNVQAQDRAYVDSPAGRSVDPARADGGSVAPGAVFVRPGGADGLNPVTQMQIQMAGMAMANARQAQAQEAAGQMPGGGAMGGMPQGGPMSGGAAGGTPMMPGMAGGMGMAPGSGINAMQPPPGMQSGYGQQQRAAGPMQQIGAGMIQDANSLMDAGIRRGVYGNDAAVMIPPEGAATIDGGGW